MTSTHAIHFLWRSDHVSDRGFGKRRLVGIACWLGYIAAIMIVGAMVAVSFRGCATSLFVGEHARGRSDNLFITALILVNLAVNLSTWLGCTGGSGRARGSRFASREPGARPAPGVVSRTETGRAGG